MNITRRKFLGGAALASAAVALPVGALAEDLQGRVKTEPLRPNRGPRLYKDPECTIPVDLTSSADGTAWVTDDCVVMHRHSGYVRFHGANLPAPLQDGTPYYAVKDGPDTIRLVPMNRPVTLEDFGAVGD